MKAKNLHRPLSYFALPELFFRASFPPLFFFISAHFRSFIFSFHELSRQTHGDGRTQGPGDGTLRDLESDLEVIRGDLGDLGHRSRVGA